MIPGGSTWSSSRRPGSKLKHCWCQVGEDEPPLLLGAPPRPQAAPSAAAALAAAACRLPGPLVDVGCASRDAVLDCCGPSRCAASRERRWAATERSIARCNDQAWLSAVATGCRCARAIAEGQRHRKRGRQSLPVEQRCPCVSGASCSRKLFCIRASFQNWRAGSRRCSAATAAKASSPAGELRAVRSPQQLACVSIIEPESRRAHACRSGSLAAVAAPPPAACSLRLPLQLELALPLSPQG